MAKQKHGSHTCHGIWWWTKSWCYYWNRLKGAVFKFLLNFVFCIWSWLDSAEQMFMLMSRLRYTMCRIRFLIRSQSFIWKIASFHAVLSYESSFTFDSDNWSWYAIYYSFAAAAEFFFSFHWRNSFQPSTVAISDVIAKWPTECQHTTKCKAIPSNGNWTSFYFWARDLCRPTKRVHPINRDVWSVSGECMEELKTVSKPFFQLNGNLIE